MTTGLYGAIIYTQRKSAMINFILGTIFGIVVVTIGFTGMAAELDKAVAVTKNVIHDSTK